MKKITSLLLIVLCVCFMIIPSMAADINTDNYNKTETLEITPEIKQEIESQLGKDLGELQTSVICNHQWTSWRTLKSWTEASADWQACVVVVTDQYRYCMKCNEMQARQERVQLAHNWQVISGGKKCTNCGKTLLNAK